MILLGWTAAPAVPPPPCSLQAADGLHAVLASEAAAATARARLLLQTRCAERLDAFLPVCPRSCLGADAPAPADARGRLEAVRGAAQLTVSVTWSAQELAGEGHRWLRARAGMAGTDGIARLRARLGAESRQPLIERRAPGRLRLDALVAKGWFGAGLGMLRRDIDALQFGPGFEVMLSGPWPALCFVSEGRAA